MKDIHTYLKQMRQLIAEGEIKQAIGRLNPLLENHPKQDELILQTSRWNRLRKKINAGTISRDEATTEENKITQALLSLIQQLQNQAQNPDARRQMEKAISIKNAVSGNIQAGGDVHIGDKNTTIIQKADKIYNIKKIDDAHFE